jgi:hypothetical protein
MSDLAETQRYVVNADNGHSLANGAGWALMSSQGTRLSAKPVAVLSRSPGIGSSGGGTPGAVRSIMRARRQGGGPARYMSERTTMGMAIDSTTTTTPTTSIISPRAIRAA